MLTGLLRLLAEGRVGSMAELAARLGTDTGSVAIALGQCQRLGYVEAAGTGAGVPGAACATSACGGCPVAGACLPGTDPGRGQALAVVPTWWQLTERGARAVRIAGGTAGA